MTLDFAIRNIFRLDKIALSLSILLFSMVLHAQTINYDQEFQVNSYTDNYQRYPTVCGISDSGFVVCWQSFGQDGHNDGIFGQIYDHNGAQRGQEFQ